MDRKPVYLMSTCYDPTEQVDITRREKDGTQLHLTCPRVVLEYNKNMGGCDKNDQMTKLYRTRKHYR